METKIQSYLDDLFDEAEETDELKDLKAEVQANFIERTKEFTLSGYDEKEAFEKACAEMGDLGELVEKMCEPKPKEKPGSNFLRGLKQILITRYDVSEE